MKYDSLKSAKILGSLSSLVATLETFNDISGAMVVSGLKQRYLTGEITLSYLKEQLVPFVCYAVRSITDAMSKYQAKPDDWKIGILDYMYCLDQVCRLL